MTGRIARSPKAIEKTPPSSRRSGRSTDAAEGPTATRGCTPSSGLWECAARANGLPD
jgi:hypothetical protein